MGLGAVAVLLFLVVVMGSRPSDLLVFERRHWSGAPGMLLAGVDEAGRGCLAGPVYAGAVVLRPDLAEGLARGELAGVFDSKRLSAGQRERLVGGLEGLASGDEPGVWFGVGVASADEVDRLNVLRATHVAMGRAVAGLGVRVGWALVDGLPVNGLPVGHEAIVGGDGRSLSIAAASIVAKVSRDRYMAGLEGRWPGYGFGVHKGYGTAAHVAALRALGPTPEHRRSFAPVRRVLDGDGLFGSCEG